MLNSKSNSLDYLTLSEQNESQYKKTPKLLPTSDFSSMLLSTKLENQKAFSHILINATAQQFSGSRLDISGIYSNCSRLAEPKPDLQKHARRLFPPHPLQDKDAQQHHPDKLGSD